MSHLRLVPDQVPSATESSTDKDTARADHPAYLAFALEADERLRATDPALLGPAAKILVASTPLKDIVAKNAAALKPTTKTTPPTLTVLEALQLGDHLTRAHGMFFNTALVRFAKSDPLLVM